MSFPASGLSPLLATAPASNGLPLPWSWTEVGAPQKPGDATWASGTFTIVAAGSDIGSSADQFGFVYQTLDGDGDIVAYIAGLDRTHPWAKAGLMFRDELTAGSKYAAAFVTAGKGLLFQYRIAAGAGTTQVAAGSGRTPAWLRLSRKGQTFTAYTSTNGAAWTMLGSEVVYLNKVVYVGLAVTSRSARSLTSADFENVVVTATPSTPEGNLPPQVAITSPPAGSTCTSPCEIDITASASDPDGPIARVDFYAGGSPIASDTSSPYTVRWSNVPAGSYTLTATARDNNGAATTSAGVPVTVAEAPPLPSLVVFNASIDHDSSVTGYTVEFFPAGADPSTSSPIVAFDIGKPVPVDGEIAVDVTSLVQNLPAGSYFSAVTAHGAGGSSRSEPSEVFVR